MIRPSALLIGMAAGFASALLFAGVVLQSPVALILSLAAPLPIIIASLGWGGPIGFVAAAVAGLALGGIASSPASGVLLFAVIALPAAILGHIAGLARPVSDGAPPLLDWFPLPRILFATAGIVALACLFVGWLIGYDATAIGNELANALRTQVTGDPASVAQLEGLARQVVGIIPVIQPALLVTLFVLCLYAAAAIVRTSGKFARPRDDLPTAGCRLPRAALPVFGVALLATFAPGNAGLVAAVAAGSFGMAFTLAGLAAIHRMTRATRSRGLVLFALYVAIAILTFPLLAATAIGLAETARQRPASPPA